MYFIYSTKLIRTAAMSEIIEPILTKEEIASIAHSIEPYCEVENYELENASYKVIGYLGEHLKLKIKIRLNEETTSLNCFVKCVPRLDRYKTDYIRKCGFFKKEFAMLTLFKDFGGDAEPTKWRPRVILLKEEVFVFEDVTTRGYRTPNQEHTMTLEELQCVIMAIAKYHASTYIFEGKSGKEKQNRLYENYKEFLYEPTHGQSWRNAGVKAIIDILLVFSKQKTSSYSEEKLQNDIPKLFERATKLMEPSTKYRNVIVHRDLWTNNIFLKYCNKSPVHAVLVDFQTVLYASPLLDISSLLYFNTGSAFRKSHTKDILELYYQQLRENLEKNAINIDLIMTRSHLMEAYEESILFGLTQAALIVPLVAMDADNIHKYFNDPLTIAKVTEVSRSEEFLEIASVDDIYKKRILELFEELVDRYIK